MRKYRCGEGDMEREIWIGRCGEGDVEMEMWRWRCGMEMWRRRFGEVEMRGIKKPGVHRHFSNVGN